MNMAIKYVCIQFCSFAVATVILSIAFGASLPMLLVGLAVSVVIVSSVAWYDNSAGYYALHGENLFVKLTDEQLRECYEAYSALEEGKSSTSMLFYQILTRYEDAISNGYDTAAEHLTSEITHRWANFDKECRMVS